MAFVGTAALVGAGASLVPAIFRGIKGISQNRKANKINPIDPGYEMNQSVIDNARVLKDRYTNYQMPGYGKAMNDINSTYGQAFDNGIQGASSGGDVLDLATKIAYGQTQAQNQLATQNATGQERALMDSLNADVQAGQQYQDKNTYDREKYQQRLAEKAQLKEAGQQNIYGALDTVAGVASKAIGSGSSTQSNTTNATSYGSIFQTPNNYNDYLLSKYKGFGGGFNLSNPGLKY